jgi:uncharacterized protein (TIGR00730 family)
MKSLAVFCGSSTGHAPLYTRHARELGRVLADRNITLVYGGGCIGLMGQMADAALLAGGKVVGVIPKSLLEREVAHLSLTELIVTETMHERKSIMADLAQGFIALPGGFGTLDELFEILTWAQLGIHSRPVALLNSGGFFDQLLGWITHVATSGFIRQHDIDRLLVGSEPEPLLELLMASHAVDAPPSPPKWVDTR